MNRDETRILVRLATVILVATLMAAATTAVPLAHQLGYGYGP